MMVIAIGLSSYNLALFHLVNHAFYKGLLFLGAGAVIHAVADNQDFRKYGGLITFLPLTYSVMLIASLSLVAFPFMTGFYSKDFILESAYGQFHFSSIAVYVIAVIGAIFTTLYSVKVLYLTFLAHPNGPYNYYRTRNLYLINQSNLIYDAIFNYMDKVVTHSGGIKGGMPMEAIVSVHDDYLVQLKDLKDSSDYKFSGIDPYKLKSLFNEIETTLWQDLIAVNLKRYYKAIAVENNSMVDFQKGINIMIDKYIEDMSDSYSQHHAHEGDIFLSLPLVILAIFSIFFGYLTKDIFIGLGSGFFIDNSIFIHPVHEIMIDTEFAVPVLFKLLPLICTISFSILAIILSEFLPESLISFKFSKLGYNIFGFFNQRFLVEMFYNKYITNLVLDLGGQTTKVLDKGSIELLGPFGLELGLVKLSKNISYLSTGVVTSYALYILAGFISYILFYTFLGQIELSIILLVIFASFSLMISSQEKRSSQVKLYVHQ
jgi:NADH:ubiquinone oxidoreductase subunit 5 (subunit L)/multisubunit Na+/H+ antiporter MnhA subunit